MPRYLNLAHSVMGTPEQFCSPTVQASIKSGRCWAAFVNSLRFLQTSFPSSPSLHPGFPWLKSWYLENKIGFRSWRPD